MLSEDEAVRGERTWIYYRGNSAFDTLPAIVVLKFDVREIVPCTR